MNIGEIAKRAGVSRSTVSYALSGKRPVSAATAQRMARIAVDLLVGRIADPTRHPATRSLQPVISLRWSTGARHRQPSVESVR